MKFVKNKSLEKHITNAIGARNDLDFSSHSWQLRQREITWICKLRLMPRCCAGRPIESYWSDGNLAVHAADAREVGWLFGFGAPSAAVSILNLSIAARISGTQVLAVIFSEKWEIKEIQQSWGCGLKI